MADRIDNLSFSTVAASNPCGLTTLPRAVVDRALRLDKNTSYRLFPASRALRGRVRLADVSSVLARSVRNGATVPKSPLAIAWLDDLGVSVSVNVCRATARRLVSRLPHLRLSGKLRLVDPSVLSAAVL